MCWVAFALPAMAAEKLGEFVVLDHAVHAMERERFMTQRLMAMLTTHAHHAKEAAKGSGAACSLARSQKR